MTPDNVIVKRGYRECRACTNARKRRWLAQRRQAPQAPTRYPAEPLIAELRRWARAHEETNGGVALSGTKLVARRYADRFGGKQLSVERRLTRLWGSEWVRADFADELAILIGLHPALVWGEAWFEAA